MSKIIHESRDSKKSKGCVQVAGKPRTNEGVVVCPKSREQRWEDNFRCYIQRVGESQEPIRGHFGCE